MSNPHQKRTDAEIEADDATIARLHLQGKSHSVIADHLNAGRPPERRISRQLVTKRLKSIRACWMESTLRDFEEAKVLELQKIDYVEAEYWEAWERSRQPLKKETQRMEGQTVFKDGAGKTMTLPSKTKIGRDVAERDGNPIFLQGVLSCIATRARILGIDRSEPTLNDGRGTKSSSTFERRLKAGRTT